jgi:2-phospho-L-lactate guanylyltransferase
VNIWAIVPLKPLNRTKSRLSPVLSQAQRERLSKQIFVNTLTTLKKVQGIGGVLVVSRDTGALALARHHEVQTVQESGAPELNDALTRATEVVRLWNAQGVLIVPADIPLLRVRDLENMLELSNGEPEIIIAPDRYERGTNALLVRPPGLIPYRYGGASYPRHVAEAKAVGAAVQVYRSFNLGLDLDTPIDLEEYRETMSQHPIGELAWLHNRA